MALKITFLVGLPGSGKTHLGEQLDNVIYLDDISVKGGLRELQNAIGSEHIVVSDVFLCRKKNRDWVIRFLGEIAPQYTVEWVFFENNPEKCLKNVEHRNKKGDCRLVGQMIKDMTKDYTIPEGHPVREIWQNDEAGDV